MNKLKQRKEELEKEIDDLAKGFYSTSDVYIDNMPELKAELKGINLGLEACEEILNSQQNKNQNSASGLVDEPRERFSSNEQKETGSADTQIKREEKKDG